MPITAQNIARHELIGIEVRIEKSSDKSKEKIEGVIIDETQKTVVIRTANGTAIIPKEECVLELRIPSGDLVSINGKILYGRPEERIKKRLPKKYNFQ